MTNYIIALFKNSFNKKMGGIGIEPMAFPV